MLRGIASRTQEKVKEKPKSRYKASGRILMIPTQDIQPNPEQPRREFRYESLLELAQSIGENGLLHPITVRFREGMPVLVAGERRLRAAIIAGMKEISCIEVEADSTRAALLTLIENLQREDMNCFEEAEGICRLISVYGLTQEEAAHQLGCAQSTVANRLRILRLDAEERATILREGLSERHARALLRLNDPDLRKAALQRIVLGKLNVVQSERLIQELMDAVPEAVSAEVKEERRRPWPLIKDVRLFINTVSHAVDTMRRSGIDASAEQTETEDYIEYRVRIPKANGSAPVLSRREHATA